jgi:hypothetical protein
MKRHWTDVLRNIAVAALALGVMTGALEERTLECEEAIAHLRDCCPGLSAPAACGDGCSKVTLSEAESECIRESDCDELRAADVCGRVETLSAHENDVDGGWEPVCP